MEQSIDLTKTVYNLVNEYPRLKDILYDLGFSELKKKSMLNSMAKLVTLPKASKVKKIPMDKVIETLKDNGFSVKGYNIDTKEKEDEKLVKISNKTSTDKLKSYLKRLSDGEDLESVRKDFVENFKSVDSKEIVNAEQELLKEGTPLNEVQKLCDVHSALFHGMTTNERDIEMRNLIEEEKEAFKKTSDEKYERLKNTVGHPIYTLTRENDELSKILDNLEDLDTDEIFKKIEDISTHYAKKGGLLYPILKVKYGISGPSDVMWTVDDEIRDSISLLRKSKIYDENFKEELDKVLKRAKEMIYKEEAILFPICSVNFSEEEWILIYKDLKGYKESFGVENERWDLAENYKSKEKESVEGEVVMPGGHLKVSELTALLNTLPLEISFVDKDDINRFFNEGDKIFNRPSTAIDRKVFSCHSPKIEPMVHQIIDSFRSGEKDSFPVWMEKKGHSVLVNYLAVRDKDNNYLGTLEIVQDMQDIKEHFTK